jgi:hypothetical protein
MATGWKAIGPANVPLLYDNGKAGTSLPSTFVRFSVRPSSEIQRNLGTNRVRVVCEGRVWLQVAVPVGTPDSEAWALADKASSIFNRWRTPDGALMCGEVSSTVPPDDKYYVIAVNVFYSSSRTV